MMHTAEPQVPLGRLTFRMKKAQSRPKIVYRSVTLTFTALKFPLPFVSSVQDEGFFMACLICISNSKCTNAINFVTDWIVECTFPECTLWNVLFENSILSNVMLVLSWLLHHGSRKNVTSFLCVLYTAEMTAKQLEAHRPSFRSIYTHLKHY